MEPEVNKDSTTGVPTPDSGAMTTMPSEPDPSTESWQKTAQQVNAFMQEFPGFLDEFWGSYKLPVIVFGFLLAFIITSKVLFAVLGAINDLPFLAPLFELVGISYFVWFLFRYLVTGSGRQELGDKVDSLKSQVVGGREKLLDRLSSTGDE